MSYTPENQRLHPSIEKILEGIEEFQEAVNNRVNNSSEWKNVHLHEITELSIELIKLKLKLNILHNETV